MDLNSRLIVEMKQMQVQLNTHDDEIDQRCHEFAVKMGVLNPVTTRHATAEEMIQFRMKGGIT